MRKQALMVHLDPPLFLLLRRASKRKKVSLGEYVRDALRKVLGSAKK
jgi:hypothetical protein